MSTEHDRHENADIEIDAGAKARKLRFKKEPETQPAPAAGDDIELGPMTASGTSVSKDADKLSPDSASVTSHSSTGVTSGFTSGFTTGFTTVEDLHAQSALEAADA